MSVKAESKSASKVDQGSIVSAARSTKKVAESDPFSCSCGPCKRFWKENFSNVAMLQDPVLKRAQKTSTMFRPDQDDWRIRVGDRVVIDGKQTGVVKFVGLLDENIIAPCVYVGVKCDEHIGSTHNGIKNGKRYFHCARGHGALVPYTDVRRINPPERQPEVTGNYMFEGYTEVVKQRTLRRQKMEAEMGETRPKPPTRVRKTYTAYDVNDIAYKDMMKKLQDAQREGETQIYHYANSTVKVRTGGPPKPKADPQARRFAKWKEDFGGGEKGEKLVKTLKKLHEALHKGKELENEPELDEDERSEEDGMSDQEGSPAPTGSKPPTRSGERTAMASSPSKSRPRTPAR